MPKTWTIDLHRIVKPASLALAAFVLCACASTGGGSNVASEEGSGQARRAQLFGRKPGAPQPVPVRPIQIVVSPKRAGGSLEVAIAVIGRGHQEGEPFEDPDAWAIEARAHGQELRRIMNGPRRVERAPVGTEDGSQWDVTVTHTVFFELPKHASQVAVRVAVPAATAVEIQSELQ